LNPRAAAIMIAAADPLVRKPAMKTLLLATVALGAFISAPAMACPTMQQSAAGSAASQTAQAGGMMCSRPSAAQAQSGQSQPGQQAQHASGCSCCNNMAMMQPPSQGGHSPSMPHMGTMPGMPQTTPAPEQPKP